ncbi:hypothetical protein DP43_2293 [Burkholderia pseudomallei]|nr:hypothetical protein DP43_2293 [Burkholderia pseudomallei]
MTEKEKTSVLETAGTLVGGGVGGAAGVSGAIAAVAASGTAGLSGRALRLAWRQLVASWVEG